MDPISDRFPWVSTYNYAENEPVAHIDLWGLQKVRAQWAKNIQQGAENTADFLFNPDNQTRLNLKAGAKVMLILHGLPMKFTEGSPSAEDYHDSGSQIKGPGITILSNDPHMANGVIDLSTSEEGSDLIIEQGDASRSAPPEGGGIVGSAATKGKYATDISNWLFNSGMAGTRVKDVVDLNQETKSQKPDTTYTTHGGTVTVREFGAKKDE